MTQWHIITGEYPPQKGGVSDYTYLLARGLCATGDAVEVWAPACADAAHADGAVQVHRLAGGFGPRGLTELEQALRRRRGGRLLVQYVPHMYGCKAMNVPFCAWLRSSVRRAPWIMFHEVAFPLARGQRLAHQLLGVAHRAMAYIAVHGAQRVFVSVPRWESQLRSFAGVRGPITWLPIPSTIPESVAADAPTRVRSSLGVGAYAPLIGHFGTYLGDITATLDETIPTLLAQDERRACLLLGRGSTEYQARLSAQHPTLAERVHALADLPAGAVAEHLAACDLLVQPYSDGVSARRTSTMASLALGKAIVTTVGIATEPVWTNERLVAAAPAERLVDCAEQLLADPRAAAELGARARSGYLQNFSLARTIETLRALDQASSASH